MITDNHGTLIDDASALHRLIVTHDLRFPDNSPGNRACRLLAALGEFTTAVLPLEHRAPLVTAGVGLGAGFTPALYDVLHTAGGIAHHFQLPIHLPDGHGDPANPFVLLARLTQAAGALAHVMTTVRGATQKTALPDQVARAVDLVLGRALALAEFYGLHHELREVIQTFYREQQAAGYLP